MSDMDELDYQVAARELKETADRAIPRLVLNPYVIALWGVFESAAREVAVYLQEQKEVANSIDQSSGTFSLEKADRYFRDCLNFVFIDKTSPEWKALMMMQDIRNAIAHTNSRMEAMRCGHRRKIENWAATPRAGIEIDVDFVYLSMLFLRTGYGTISTVLKDLMTRAKLSVDQGRPPQRLARKR